MKIHHFTVITLFSVFGTLSLQAADVPRSERLSMADAITESVSLNDEQKTKFDALANSLKEATDKVREAAAISRTMNQTRQKTVNSAPDSLEGKKVFEKAIEEAGYTEEQAKAQKKIGALYRKFRFDVMSLLSPEQRKQMPSYHQKEFSEESAKKAD